MEIKLSIGIERNVEEVFDFLTDFRNHHQETKSQVLLVEKLTPDLSGIRTRYREVVLMMPMLKTEMITEVTRFEPNELLEFTWSGGGMEGVLEYSFEEVEGSTILNFNERIHPKGIMKLARPIIQASFQKTMVDRLEGIRRKLEEE